MTRVLFVCLGNICRSPTAHGVFAALVERHGLAQSIEVDSCGTGGWHVGEPPDRRATLEAGADAVVLKRAIATDLLPAIEAVQDGRSFVTRGNKPHKPGEGGWPEWHVDKERPSPQS